MRSIYESASLNLENISSTALNSSYDYNKNDKKKWTSQTDFGLLKTNVISAIEKMSYKNCENLNTEDCLCSVLKQNLISCKNKIEDYESIPKFELSKYNYFKDILADLFLKNKIDVDILEFVNIYKKGETFVFNVNIIHKSSYLNMTLSVLIHKNIILKLKSTLNNIENIQFKPFDPTLNGLKKTLNTLYLFEPYLTN
jgi:hypothetical protein